MEPVFNKMWQQLTARFKDGLAVAWGAAGPWLLRAAALLVAFVRGPVRDVAQTLLQIVAALIVLFLEWGWRPLEAALARLSKYFVFARVEAWLKSLPPYGALAMFAAPAVCLFPLKLLALYLFATGHAVLGVVLIGGAKVAGTAIVAHIFMLTQPQLMQIAWFKTAYDVFIPWKEQMFAQIRASAVWRNGRIVRVEVKRWVNRTWLSLKPQRAWVKRQAAIVKADVMAWIARLSKALR
ncbi:MAG: hypothetical protein ABL901_19785 [Hyphomicrobiaceae bacterium]